LLHQHSQISELPCTEWTEYTPMTHWKRTTECNNNNSTDLSASNWNSLWTSSTA